MWILIWKVAKIIILQYVIILFVEVIYEMQPEVYAYA